MVEINKLNRFTVQPLLLCFTVGSCAFVVSSDLRLCLMHFCKAAYGIITVNWIGTKSPVTVWDYYHTDRRDYWCYPPSRLQDKSSILLQAMTLNLFIYISPTSGSMHTPKQFLRQFPLIAFPASSTTRANESFPSCYGKTGM